MSPKFVCWFKLLKLTSHMILVAMETIFGGNYGCLNYQIVCIYKMACRSINTISTVSNYISLERVGYQNSDNVCGICITSQGVEIWVKMYYTCDILCEYCHTLDNIFLTIAAIQIPHTLWKDLLFPLIYYSSL